MVTCAFALSLTRWCGSSSPEIFIGTSVDCAPGGLAHGFASLAYAFRHAKLSHHTTAILCAAQVLLPMAICLRLCCKTHDQTPWNFDIIFFCLAERLAAQSFSLRLATPSGKLDDPSFSRALPALALSKEFCSDSSFETYNRPPTIVSGIIIAAPQD
jgi:hypothetical protein